MNRNEVKVLREKLGISMRKLGILSGVNHVAISRYESGKNISLKNYLKLQAYFLKIK